MGGGEPASAVVLASLTVGDLPRGEGCEKSGSGLSLRDMAGSGGRSDVDNEWSRDTGWSSGKSGLSIYR